MISLKTNENSNKLQRNFEKASSSLNFEVVQMLAELLYESPLSTIVMPCSSRLAINQKIIENTFYK